MKPRKGQEFQKVVTHKIVSVGDGFAVVEDRKTGVKTAVDLNAAGELEDYELISHGGETPDSNETPPDLRRMPPGSKRGPNVMMDAESASAYAFNLEWMRANPDKRLPSNQSGVFCMAQREFAKRRGWKKGMTTTTPKEG